MKSIKILILAVLALTLNSCSEDDDSVDLNNENIIGNYDITLYEGFREEFETTSNGAEVLIETERFTTDTFTNAIFSFDENGNYSINGSYRITYTLTVSGQSPQVTSEIRSVNDDDSFFITNGSLITGDIGYSIESFDGVNLNLIASNNPENFDDTNSTKLFSITLRLRKR